MPLIDPKSLLFQDTATEVSYGEDLKGGYSDQKVLANLEAIDPHLEENAANLARQQLRADAKYNAQIAEWKKTLPHEEIKAIVDEELKYRTELMREQELSKLAQNVLRGDTGLNAKIVELKRTPGITTEYIRAFVQEHKRRVTDNIRTQLKAPEMVSERAVAAGGGVLPIDYQSLTPSDKSGTTPYRLRTGSALRLAAKELGGDEGAALHLLSMKMMQSDPLPGDTGLPNKDVTPEMRRAIDEQYEKVLQDPSISPKAKELIAHYGRTRHGTPEEAWEEFLGNVTGLFNIGSRALTGVGTGTLDALRERAEREGDVSTPNAVNRAGAAIYKGAVNLDETVSSTLRGGGSEDSPGVLESSWASKHPALAASLGMSQEIIADLAEIPSGVAKVAGGSVGGAISLASGGSVAGVPAKTFGSLLVDFSPEGLQDRKNILTSIAGNVASAVSGTGTDKGTAFDTLMKTREHFQKQAYKQLQAEVDGGMPSAESVEARYRELVNTDVAAIAIDNPHEAQLVTDVFLDPDLVFLGAGTAIRGTAKLLKEVSSSKAFNVALQKVAPLLPKGKLDNISRSLWSKFSTEPYDAAKLEKAVDEIVGEGAGAEFTDAIGVERLRGGQAATNATKELKDLLSTERRNLDPAPLFALPSTKKKLRETAYNLAKMGARPEDIANPQLRKAVEANTRLAAAEQAVREGNPLVNWQIAGEAKALTPAALRQQTPYVPGARQEVVPELEKDVISSTKFGAEANLKMSSEYKKVRGNPVKDLFVQHKATIDEMTKKLEVTETVARQFRTGFNSGVATFVKGADNLKSTLKELEEAYPGVQFDAVGAGRGAGVTADLGEEAMRVANIENFERTFDAKFGDMVSDKSKLVLPGVDDTYVIMPRELAVFVRDTIDTLGPNGPRDGVERALHAALNGYDRTVGSLFKVGATLGRLGPYLWRNLNTALVLPASVGKAFKSIGNTKDAIIATLMKATGGTGDAAKAALSKTKKLKDGTTRSLGEAWKDLDDAGFMAQTLDKAGMADSGLVKKALGNTIVGTPIPTFGAKRLSGITNLQANQNIENLQKMLTYLNFLEGSSPAAINKALRMTQKYAGHFRNLAPFEREVMTKIAPFWAWTKYASTGLASGVVKKPAFTMAAQRWLMYHDKRNRNMNRQFSRETMPEWTGEFATMSQSSQQPDDYKKGQAISLPESPMSIAFWWFNGERAVKGLLGPYLPVFAYEMASGRDWETDQPAAIQPTIEEHLEIALGKEKGFSLKDADKFLKKIGRTHPAIAALTSPIRAQTEDLSMMIRASEQADNPEWTDELKLQWALGNRLPIYKYLLNLYRDYKGLEQFDKGGVGLSSSYLTQTPESVTRKKTSSVLGEVRKVQDQITKD